MQVRTTVCGHEVILLPAHKVVPYVQGEIRAVAVKTVEQQGLMIAWSAERNALRAQNAD